MPNEQTKRRMMSAIRHLPFFVAVAELENFKKAAARLGIVQPALSRRIHELENELGIQLFDRLPRGVRLNEAGRVLLEDGRRTLDQLDRAYKRAIRAARGEIGTLRICLTDAALQNAMISMALRRFRTNYPSVNLRLEPMRSQAQLTALRAGEFDAGFLYINPGEKHEFNSLRMLVDDFVVAMDVEHRLAQRKTLRLVDLAEEDFIWPVRTEASRFSDRLVAAFSKQHVSPKIVMELLTVEQMLSVIAAGTGIGFIPRSQSLARPGIIVRHIEDFSVPLYLEMLWRKGDHNLLLSRLSDAVREALQQAR